MDHLAAYASYEAVQDFRPFLALLARVFCNRLPVRGYRADLKKCSFRDVVKPPVKCTLHEMQRIVARGECIQFIYDIVAL